VNDGHEENPNLLLLDLPGMEPIPGCWPGANGTAAQTARTNGATQGKGMRLERGRGGTAAYARTPRGPGPLPDPVPSGHQHHRSQEHQQVTAARTALLTNHKRRRR
jgi:hypothetical protein